MREFRSIYWIGEHNHEGFDFGASLCIKNCIDINTALLYHETTSVQCDVDRVG